MVLANRRFYFPLGALVSYVHNLFRKDKLNSLAPHFSEPASAQLTLITDETQPPFSMLNLMTLYAIKIRSSLALYQNNKCFSKLESWHEE